MKYIHIITLMLFPLAAAHAQVPDWQWAKTIGSAATSGNDGDEGNDIAVDGAGNVYVVGTYHGLTDFGGLYKTSVGASDVFVASYDCSGKLRWVRGGGAESATNKGQAISIHGDAVYVGGRYGQQFSPDSVRFADTAFRNPGIFAGRSDMFVAKFDTAGNFHWLRSNQVQVSYDASPYMALDNDAQGNLYYTANSQRQTFPGTGYNAYGFLAKYDPQGNLLRVSEVVDFSTGSLAYITSIAIDDVGNAYIGGVFQDTVYIGGSQGIQIIANQNNTGRSFISKFDTSGIVTWARKADSGPSATGGIMVTSINSSESVMITGGFQNYMYWGGGDSLVRQSQSRPYLYVFDTIGNDLKSTAPENVISNSGVGTSIDINGNLVAITSQIRGPLTWDGITDSSKLGISDPVLYILDTALNVQSINVMPTVGNEDGTLSAAVFDHHQNIYMTGHVGGDVRLPTDTAYYQGGNTDAVLAKFGNICPITSVRNELVKASDNLRLLAYPNPTDGLLTLRHDMYTGGGQLLLYDMQGRLLLQRDIHHGSEQTELDLSGRAAGLYLVSVVTESGRSSVKVVVEY